MRDGFAGRATKFLVFGVMAILAFFLFGFVVRALWNWLMPALFGLHVITYWQAIGLVVLSKILFGSFHSHGGRGKRGRDGMRERWEHLSPEERERFRQGIGGFAHGPSAEPKV